MLVYVVVPRANLRGLLIEALQTAGHVAVQFSSGELAIDACATKACDALVVDHKLPGRDGLLTVETIRGIVGVGSIRVALLMESEADGSAPLLASRIDAASVLVGDGDRPSVERFLRPLFRKPSVATLKAMSLSNPFTGEMLLPEGRLTAIDGVHPAHEDDETLRARATNAAREPSAEMLLVSTEGEALVDEASFEEATWVEGARERATRPEIRRQQSVSEISGSLAVTPFPEVLAQMANERRDGGLVCGGTAFARRTVDGREPTKIVCFRAGVPVDVRTNLVDESLLALLQRQRRIDPAQYEAACQMEKEHAMSAEDVILRLRILDPIALAEAMAEQLRLKIIDLFAWRSGRYVLDDRMQVPTRAVGLPYSFAELLFDGVRTAMPMSWLMDYVEKWQGSPLILVTESLQRAARLTLSSQVSNAIRSMNKDSTVRTFVASAGTNGQARQAMEALYALVCLDVLRIQNRELGPLDGFVSEHLIRTVEVPISSLVSMRKTAELSGQTTSPKIEGPTRLVDIAQIGRSLRSSEHAPSSAPAPVREVADGRREREQLEDQARRTTIPGMPITPSSQDLVVAGFGQMRAGRWRDAEGSFAAALVLEPARQDAAAYRALSAIGILHDERAVDIVPRGQSHIQVLVQTVDAHPRSASLHFALARAYELLGQHQSAKEAIRRAVAIDPSHEDAVQLLRRVANA